MTFVSRLATAAGISLALTFLLLLLFQDDTPVRAARAQAPANSIAGSR